MNSRVLDLKGNLSKFIHVYDDPIRVKDEEMISNVRVFNFMKI